MDENYATFLGFSIGAVALFSFLAVASWANARRREREAYYKSEAIKKIAEIQGTVPEAVLALLHQALTTAPEPERGLGLANPGEYRREREAYRQGEMVKRIAEMPGGGAEAAMTYLREEERKAMRRQGDGIKLAGLIVSAAGVGLLAFLRLIVPETPVYMVALIPMLVGAALLTYAYIIAPSD